MQQMADKPTLKLRIVNPERKVFEGEVEMVFAPGIHGMLGIMPMHTPLYAELVAGEIHITGAQEKSIEIESGIMKVRNNEVTILIGL